MKRTKNAVRSILIVDDDLETQRGLQRLFGMYYDVTIASTAIEAWHLICDRGDYDAIVTDYDFGDTELDGAQLTNVLQHRNDNNVPIIMYTGTPKEDLNFGMRKRPHKIVAKPHTGRLFTTLLDEWAIRRI